MRSLTEISKFNFNDECFYFDDEGKIYSANIKEVKIYGAANAGRANFIDVTYKITMGDERHEYTDSCLFTKEEALNKIKEIYERNLEYLTK